MNMFFSLIFILLLFLYLCVYAQMRMFNPLGLELPNRDTLTPCLVLCNSSKLLTIQSRQIRVPALLVGFLKETPGCSVTLQYLHLPSTWLSSPYSALLPGSSPEQPAHL